jgi:hypothetical protein
MYKDLDIDITDDAYSTVIHVTGPVSARMCDVGSVFDQLGKWCWPLLQFGTAVCR